eukprot:1267472-Amphidinium_carterae.1
MLHVGNYRCRVLLAGLDLSFKESEVVACFCVPEWECILRRDGWLDGRLAASPYLVWPFSIAASKAVSESRRLSFTAF